MRPNVLVVVFDAARRSAFEPYGAPAGSTPTVAQLASRGTALPDVYATSCWTVPSHSSLFTGLMPRAAGLSKIPSHAAAKPAMQALRDRHIGDVLKRAGYSTAAASANLWLAPASGFDTGFDEFVQADTGRHAQIHRGGRVEHARWLLEGLRGRADDGAARVEAVIERWLGERSDAPFFWFVNLLECHSPYLPPRPYGGRSPLRRLRAAEDARRYYTLREIWRTCGGLTTVPGPALERARHYYHASIRYMDDWLGRVLERLDAAGALDDTLVVVLADHGENFGEGGFTAHAMSLDNRLIHVPLVFSDAAAVPDGVTSLAELPRVIAEYAGVTDHPYTDGPSPGIGVAQFDPPAEPGDEEALRNLEEWGLAESLDLFTTPLTCAVAGDSKLLRRGDREELYDLAADPLEARPLTPEELGRPEELAKLRAALQQPAVSRSRDAASAPEAEISDDERRELERRMELLGYM